MPYLPLLGVGIYISHVNGCRIVRLKERRRANGKLTFSLFGHCQTQTAFNFRAVFDLGVQSELQALLDFGGLCKLPWDPTITLHHSYHLDKRTDVILLCK